MGGGGKVDTPDGCGTHPSLIQLSECFCRTAQMILVSITAPRLGAIKSRMGGWLVGRKCLRMFLAHAHLSVMLGRTQHSRNGHEPHRKSSHRFLLATAQQCSLQWCEFMGRGDFEADHLKAASKTRGDFKSPDTSSAQERCPRNVPSPPELTDGAGLILSMALVVAAPGSGMASTVDSVDPPP